MTKSQLRQLIKECLVEQTQDLMAAAVGSPIENISFGMNAKKINVKLVNGVVIQFSSQTPIKAENLGPLNEMDLKGLKNVSRLEKDFSDPNNSFKRGIKTKINPYDDKDFAMESKEALKVFFIIDIKAKAPLLNKNGVEYTGEAGKQTEPVFTQSQWIIDDLVESIGNFDKTGVVNNFNKLDKILNNSKSLVGSDRIERYNKFKDNVLNQI